MLRPRWIPRTVLLALLIGATACSSSGIRGDGGGSRGDGGGSGGDGGTSGGDGSSNGPTLVGLTITPTSAVLISVDGSRPTQSFVVTGVWSDGSRASVPNLRLSVSPVTLGTISATTSVFVANGRFGGAGVIHASGGGHVADASIRIEIDQTILGTGTPTGAPALFPSPITDPMRTASIVYPLDRAVMPANVAPAEIQWLNSSPGDVFRIQLIKPSVHVTAYVANTGPGFKDSWIVELDAWRRIAQSESSDDALITVDRWELASRQAIASGAPVRVHFANAALLGSIYYWDIAAGRIVRINDGTNTRDAFMPNPMQGCVGCHSVSPSGRYMAGRYGPGENVGAVFDLTRDLTGNPPQTLFSVTSTTVHWWFSSWSPDEKRMIVSQNEPGGNGNLAFLDPFQGTVVPSISGTLPSHGVTQPAWAPDNTAIAYVGNVNDWGGVMVAGDIFMLPVLGLDQVGTPTRVITGAAVPNAIPSGGAACYPTWTPDSAWIAFAHGASSRSENGTSALYAAKRDGSDLVRLNNASGGPSTQDTFQPRFSPFNQGGYFWLTFLSKRDYGNNKAGTAGAARQQIWVAAFKSNPAPGEDPTEVAYWLPGQDTASMNISAYWAPRACHPTGAPCSVSVECCSADCQPDTTNTNTCAPPSTQCRPLRATCTDSAQCCDGVLCVDNTCGSL
jgi:hypothetical protein